MVDFEGQTDIIFFVVILVILYTIVSCIAMYRFVRKREGKHSGTLAHIFYPFLIVLMALMVLFAIVTTDTP